MRLPLLSLTLGVLVSTCGGSGGPTSATDPGNDDDPGNPGGGTRVIKANPSFAADIVEIFVRRSCTLSSCHGSGDGELTLTASASTNYGNLVAVQSPSSGVVRVIPYDAANSYLVKKLEGTQGSGNGERMPLMLSPLDNIDITNIKNWINAGAPNN